MLEELFIVLFEVVIHTTSLLLKDETLLNHVLRPSRVRDKHGN